MCGKLAELECKECFGSLQFGAGLESTSFCKLCLEKVHSHDKRLNHSPRELEVPQDFLMMAEHITVPRIFMELFAVVCIETSHYVAFVKCGSGLDAPWCFFDSMVDRKGTSLVRPADSICYGFLHFKVRKTATTFQRLSPCPICRCGYRRKVPRT